MSFIGRSLGLLGALLVVGAASASSGPLAGSALPSGNLIRNPGAEEGSGGSFSGVVALPGWQTASSFTAVAYSTPDSPPIPAGGGSNYFAGGPATALSTASQEISFAEHAADVAKGGVQAVLKGDLGGYFGQGDAGTVAAFLMDGGSEVGRITIGPVSPTEREGQKKFLTRTATATVPSGTDAIRVVMTATRAAGEYNDAYFDNLSLTLSAGGAVGTSFDGGSTSPSVDVGAQPEAPSTTLETQHTSEATQLALGVQGNGVVSQAAGLRYSARAAAPLSCGLNRFFCYSRLEPRQRVTLRARPSPGWTFKAWTGACEGQGPTCTISPTRLATVSSIFVLSSGAAPVPVSLQTPRFSVRWKSSAGTGALGVRGSVGREARVLVQLRRPGGGPFLLKRLQARGGFRTSISLAPKQLPIGAKLFPGGFVVSVTGTREDLQLPLQLRTVVLGAPPEGVVRTSSAGRTRAGPVALRLPLGSKEAWARFRYAAQPLSRLPVTVTWYRPGGRKLATVVRANRPEVASRLHFAAGLPRGLWVAELRAGSRITKRLAVRIG